MPRLVYREGKSKKFWHGWVDGLELNVRFGKLGSDGTEQRKKLASKEAAQKELEKLVKQKLAKGYADDARAWTYESSLEVHELVDPPLPVLDGASLAHEEAGMKNGWSYTFWNGDYAFAMQKKGDGWIGGLIDGTAKPKWRAATPAIEGPTLNFAFDESNARFAVGAPAGPVFIVDCETAKASKVVPSGDDVIEMALAGERVALLRKKDGKTRLEIWKNEKLEHTLACSRQDTLFAFGGGRALMVGWVKQDDSWDGKSWPSTHFIAIDGEPRLLGTNGMSISHAYVKDGRAIYVADVFGMMEITNLDAALSKGKPIKTLT